MNGRASVSIWAISLISCLCCLSSGCPAPAPVTPAVPTEESAAPPDIPAEKPVAPSQREVQARQPTESESPSPPSPQAGASPAVPQRKPKGPPQDRGPPVTGASPSGGRAVSLKKAQRLFDSAKSKRQAGNYSEAFLEAREAWTLVQESDHHSDQEFSAEIREELDFLADKLTPSKQDQPSKFKTLILK